MLKEFSFYCIYFIFFEKTSWNLWRAIVNRHWQSTGCTVRKVPLKTRGSPSVDSYYLQACASNYIQSLSYPGKMFKIEFNLNCTFNLFFLDMYIYMHLLHFLKNIRTTTSIVPSGLSTLLFSLQFSTALTWISSNVSKTKMRWLTTPERNKWYSTYSVSMALPPVPNTKQKRISSIHI